MHVSPTKVKRSITPLIAHFQSVLETFFKDLVCFRPSFLSLSTLSVPHYMCTGCFSILFLGFCAYLCRLFLTWCVPLSLSIFVEYREVILYSFVLFCECFIFSMGIGLSYICFEFIHVLVAVVFMVLGLCL